MPMMWNGFRRFRIFICFKFELTFSFVNTHMFLSLLFMSLCPLGGGGVSQRNDQCHLLCRFFFSHPLLIILLYLEVANQRYDKKWNQYQFFWETLQCDDFNYRCHEPTKPTSKSSFDQKLSWCPRWNSIYWTP